MGVRTAIRWRDIRLAKRPVRARRRYYLRRIHFPTDRPHCDEWNLNTNAYDRVVRRRQDSVS